MDHSVAQLIKDTTLAVVVASQAAQGALNASGCLANMHHLDGVFWKSTRAFHGGCESGTIDELGIYAVVYYVGMPTLRSMAAPRLA